MSCLANRPFFFISMIGGFELCTRVAVLTLTYFAGFLLKCSVVDGIYKNWTKELWL